MHSLPEIIRPEVRQKLFAYFFTNPESRHYVREMASILHEDPGNLSRELSQLERAGVFLSETRGRQKYYVLNKDYPLYNELAGIVFKTVGVAGALNKTLSDIPGVRTAFLYGSFAKTEQRALSDIDVVIVGQVNESTLTRRVGDLERKLNREINYTLFSPEAWQQAKRQKGSFASRLLSEPIQMLVGRRDEL